MPTVEVYKKDDMKPLFAGRFTFLTRHGETISNNVGGYLNYYKVVEVWHREEAKSRVFRACVRVETDD